MAVAVVAAAGVTLLPAGVNTVAKGLAFVAALMAAASGLHELGVLGVGAAAALLGARWRATATAPVLVPLWGLAAPALAVSAAGPWAIFGTFFKIGSLLFGSGYVLFAFLNAELVDRLQWLTPQALLDAIAVGQVTPGPVFTTATFIGYVIDGPRGAFAATAGVFLPAFVFVAASGPLVRLLRGSGASRALMDGVVAASLALLVMVTVALASSGLVDVWTWGLALAAFTVLIVWRVNPMWCLLAGAAVGLLVAMAG
jgi:chromate transporter